MILKRKVYDPIVQKELDNMPTQLFSIKDDLLFQKGGEFGAEQGFEKGIEKGTEIKRDFNDNNC